MNKDDFLLLQSLFAKAIEIPLDERARWLDALTTTNARVLDELRLLLDNDDARHSVPDAMPLELLGAALSSASEAAPAAPKRAGKFVLFEEIGRGGMGSVYRGVREDDGVRQEAAVKVLHRDSRNGSGMDRFLAERRLLARLDHPGIARLLDSGETDAGAPFVAMELVAGRPLLDHCDAHALDVTARIGIFRQILDAVAHAHGALVVHRDVKPCNVMVDAHGRVRLLDFGIAKELHVGDSTATADRYFTPAYAAPEQLSGDPITVACDIYSLGALLYELLCGLPPFAVAGKRAVDVERLILATPPRPMGVAFRSLELHARVRLAGDHERTWAAQLHGDLESIVQLALHKDPRARYASVQAFDTDLANWLGHRPVRATGAGRLYRARKFLRRNATACASIAIVTISLLVASVLVVRQGVIAKQERDRARHALAALSSAFVAADPLGVSGGEVSARDILERASRRIAADVSNQPEVYAELAAEIAGVQLALGIVDVPDDSLSTALAWAESRADQQPLVDRLTLLDARRGVARHAFEDADKALVRLEASLPGEGSVLLTRGKYWLSRNKPEQALPFLTAALERFPVGSENGQRLDTQWQLAEAQRLGGHPADALETLTRAQAELGAGVDERHASLLLTRLRSVDVLIDLARIDEAVEEAQVLAAAITASYGERSSITALAYSTWATTLVRAARYPDSIEPYRLAATSYGGSLGMNHITTARSYFNLALMQAYVDPQDPASEPGFEHAIAVASHVRSPTDPLVLFFRIEFAKSLMKRGQRDRAQEVLVPEPFVATPRPADAETSATLRMLLDQAFGHFDCPSASVQPSAMASRRDHARALYCTAANAP